MNFAEIIWMAQAIGLITILVLLIVLYVCEEFHI